jgi:sugar lactone lactonase YvrE
MKKLVSTIFLFALLFSANAFAQNWVYKGIFPSQDTLKTNSGVQFVTVDPDGKVWIAPYRTNVDSFYWADSSRWVIVRPVYVYNSDGTPWDTIKAVTINNVVYPLLSSKYGIASDNNGNILVCDYNVLVRINYKTGEGMNIVDPGISAIGAPAVDANGNIYMAPVLPGYPVVIYGSDFSFQGNAVDTMKDYGRCMLVSPDGNTLYIPRFGLKVLLVYNRPDEFSPYVLVDSALKGAMIESGTWDPIDKGMMWLSVSSYFDPGTGEFANREGQWLEFDPTNWTVKDSIKWNFFTPQDPDERPRGIAFSNDGKTAYVACFGSSAFPPVETFYYDRTTGIQKDKNSVVKSYNLSQNYPNPFNPSTEINFTVAKSGFVTLRVYDMLGREVATLVNKEMSSGNYNVNFDASRLSSGTYIYQLNVNGVMISKKMTLLK